MMRRRIRSARPVAILLAALAAAAALQAVPALARDYMTPGFMLKSTRPMRIAVLPPHAKFVKAKAAMTAEMVKEAGALEDEAAQAIARNLEGKGYEVRLITPQDLADEPALRGPVTSLQNRYDEELSKMLRRPKDVRQGRYGAGAEAITLAALLHVDGLVVARVAAVGNTGGRQALTIVLSFGGAYAQSSARMVLGVLDGGSGRVEGYFDGHRNTTTRKLTRKPAVIMTDLADVVLRHYLEAGEVKQPRKMSEAEAAKEEAREEAEPEADEDAIDDFEAVIGDEHEEPPPAAPEPPPSTEKPPAPEPPPAPPR